MTTTLLLFNILSGLLAQWLAQGTHNPLVTGSNPVGPTKDIYTHTKKRKDQHMAVTINYSFPENQLRALYLDEHKKILDLLILMR